MTDYDIIENENGFTSASSLGFRHTDKPRHVWDWVDGAVINVQVGRVYATDAQQYLAEQLCLMLNMNHSHDGRWQVTWCAPSQRSKRLHGVFRPAMPETLMFSFYTAQIDDPLAKLCFDVVVDDDFLTIAEENPQHWLDQCEQAFEDWYEKVYKEAVLHGDKQMVEEAISSPMAAGEVISRITN